MNEKEPKKALNKFARFSGIAFQMVGIIYFGNMLGIWFEDKYKYNGSKDIITLLAVFLAIYTIIIQVIKLSKNS